MSNDIKSGNMNEQSGTGKNDPHRTTEAPKNGQQSQGTTPRTDKASGQQGGGSDHKSGQQSQGGSDQKSGQQSQGGSRADDDGMKQPGSSNVANDPKKTQDSGQKTANK